MTALAGSVALALATGVSPSDLARFTFATLWSVLLPGLFVVRLARPRRPSFAGELATGFVVGLGVQLVAWAGFVGLGGAAAGRWLALYPLAFVGAAALSPRLRRLLVATPHPQRMPTAAAWALCVAYLLAIARLGATVLQRTPLPPGSGRWYQDLYWHLSISADALHSAPPGVPQVAGEPLHYHWFANAHMAADSLVAGVDVLVVTARLWYLPVYAVTVVLTYLLAVRLTKAPWAGVLAVALVVVPSALAPVRWVAAVGAESLIPQSPSQVFGLPVLLALAAALTAIVNAPSCTAVGRGEWGLLVLFAGLAAGSKSSILPTVLAALLLVLAVTWWRRRTEPTSPLAPTLVATAVVTAVLVPASQLLAGGSAGSTLGLLTAIDQTAALRHATALERSGTIEAPLLLTLAGLLGVLVAAQFAGVLLAWPLRHDPRVVLLGGCVVAGFGAMMVVHHPGGSQLYFMRGVLPLVAVLAAWGAAHAVRREALSSAQTARAVAMGSIAGLTGWVAIAWAGGAQQGSQTGILRLLLALSVLAACGATAVLVLRSQHRRSGSGVAVVTALLVAVLIPSAVGSGRGVVDAVRSSGPSQLSAAQIAGTTWLRQNTPADTVIATNVHCASGATRPGCDARAFWVTGLGERRAFVESWGYTDQAQATAKVLTGVRHVNYARVPFFEPARLQLNDAAFTAPTAEGLARLYAAGVRVLFADSTAGLVSPGLATLARPVFRDGGVSIYLLSTTS